jgi:hypothetical protein
MNLKVILHGFFVAVGTAISGCLLPLIQGGAFPGKVQLLAAACVGLFAGVVYVSKLPIFGSAGDTFNLKTVIHGFYLSAITTIGGLLLPILNSGDLPSEKTVIAALLVGLGAGITYISKLPVLGSSKDIPKTTEPK